MRLFSPAKINLNLHVTGRRDDGYHNLSSLVCFARDVGDTITITPSDKDIFTVTGEYAHNINTKNNSILDALQWIRTHYESNKSYDIHLEKSLPVAAGIGGGSSNAATFIRIMLNTLNIPLANDIVRDSFVLGADVPICLLNRASIVEKAGEDITPIDTLPALNAVIINPNISCHTKDIFKNVSFSDAPDYSDDVMRVIKNSHNDLTYNAVSHVPEIAVILDVLNAHNNCTLARMSGSGATCFALFDDLNQAEEARDAIQTSHPDWWVRASRLS